jgi:exonuclease SbcD
MLTAHLADTHITERPGEGQLTLDEQVESLQWIGRDAEEQGAELICHGGDVFDHLSTPTERNAAIAVFADWASRMPVVVVYGNHDRPGDLDYLEALRTQHSITVFSTPGRYIASGATIACLPWPRKANLAGRLAAGQNVSAAAAEAMRAILQGFAVDFATSKDARILLAHAELGGAQLDNGQPVAGRADIELAEADLAATGADAVLLGHIHKRQTIGDRIHYAGSPRPTAFGQEGPHGYTLIDVDRGRAPVRQFRQAPYRPMVTIEGEWIPYTTNGADLIDVNIFDWSGADCEPGAAVRLQYTVSEDQRVAAGNEAERAKASLLANGAHSVKIDAKVTPVHRVRSEEIREARTTADRIEAWWSSREQRPERAEVILDKLGEIESEVTT